MLRIDDDYAGPLMDVPDTFLTHSNGPIESLHNFKDACRLFAKLGKTALPDIVLIDVNFVGDRDDYFGGINKPLGLLYGLAYLACARAQHQPIGFAHHTVDASIWRGLVPFEMGALAGQLAALHVALIDDDGAWETLDTCDQALEWIAKNVPDNVHDAEQHSIRAFRKDLLRKCTPQAVVDTRVIIDPIAHIELLNACDEIGRLHADLPVPPEALNRLGITVVVDGRPDCYSLSSLFGDVEGGLRCGDLVRREARSGGTYKDAPFLHDRPDVMKFLDDIGCWVPLYKAAKQAVKSLGDGKSRHTRSIKTIIGENAQDARFLALAFKIVDLYHAAWCGWCQTWLEVLVAPWEAAVSDPDSPSLKDPVPLSDLFNELLDILWKCAAQEPNRQRSQSEQDASVATAIDVDEDTIGEALIDEGWPNVLLCDEFRARDITDTAALVERLEHCQSLCQASDRLASSGPSGGHGKVFASEGRQSSMQLSIGRLVAGTGVREIAKQENGASAFAVLLNNVKTQLQVSKLQIVEALGNVTAAPGELTDWVGDMLLSLQTWGYVRKVSTIHGSKWRIMSSRQRLGDTPPAVTWIDDAPTSLSQGAVQSRLISPGRASLTDAAGLGEYKQILSIERSLGYSNLLAGLVEGSTDCPKWLAYLCQQYCLETDDNGLNWTDSRSWPPFLRVGR